MIHWLAGHASFVAVLWALGIVLTLLFFIGAVG